VGIPGKWSTETLADAVEAATGYRLVIDMGQVCLNLTNNQLMFQDHNLCELDALMVKKISAKYSPNTLDRIELLRIAEHAGVKVFSRPERIIRLVDRLSCTISLRNAGIPMPETRVTEDIATAMEIVQEFGQAIFKPLYSTKASGMCVMEAGMDKRELEKAIRRFSAEHPMMYIQKKINLPGQDLGLVFLAGEYLGTYARVGSKEAWNTTIKSGGRYAPHDTPASIVEMARRAQEPFGMDFTTVDVAETDDGPVVFEVSAFGGFRGAHEGMGVNVAERYVEHVLKQIKS
jgi:ribosomal protein S6--L-glutamate ligase